MRYALIACIGLGLMACASYQQRPMDGKGATVKIVDAKRPPVALYAVDRSICLVTVERYRNVRIGDPVYCNWSGGTGDMAGSPAPGIDDRGGIPRSTAPVGQQDSKP